MRLAQGGREHAAIVGQTGDHEYFSPDSTMPAWYREEIRGQGRYYRIQGDAAEVIVDDEQNVVFIAVSSSTM